LWAVWRQIFSLLGHRSSVCDCDDTICFLGATNNGTITIKFSLVCSEMSTNSVTIVRKIAGSSRKSRALGSDQSPINPTSPPERAGGRVEKKLRRAGDHGSPSPRGRPREFDEDKALDHALELFWRQGYEGTSIADLRKAIGITAPSLYAAFGSKEELYRRVLERYLTGLGRCLADALGEELAAYAALERFLFESARNFSSVKNPPGCLISCAIPTCAPENRAVADVVASKRKESLHALRSRFQLAVKSGELPRGTDPEQLARFYGAVIQGMSIQALDGAGTKALQGIVEAALRAWPVPAQQTATLTSRPARDASRRDAGVAQRRQE
jgi:AcrR family transcriptional regulator